MMLEHDLVDELRLKVFPVVLGSGQRLFGETRATKHLHLVESETLGDGIALLTYASVREDRRLAWGPSGETNRDFA